jgi:hypothetical protein
LKVGVVISSETWIGVTLLAPALSAIVHVASATFSTSDCPAHFLFNSQYLIFTIMKTLTVYGTASIYGPA